MSVVIFNILPMLALLGGPEPLLSPIEESPFFAKFHSSRTQTELCHK